MFRFILHYLFLLKIANDTDLLFEATYIHGEELSKRLLTVPYYAVFTVTLFLYKLIIYKKIR